VRCRLKGSLLIAGACQLLLAPVSNAAEDASQAARAAFPEMDRLVAQRMEESSLPGVVYGVVIDGELAHVATFGFRNVDKQLKVQDDTIFRIASMSKSFTALSIMMLRDDGALSLDDAVERHVPEMESMPLPTRDSAPVTIRQLLTHTAGFPEDNPWGDRQMEVPHDEFGRWLAAGIPFSTAPGTAYEYSNTGFALLGRIVANVSGMSFPEFVQQRILDPLEMTSTYWDVEKVPLDRTALGYSLGGGHTSFAPGDPEGELSIDPPLGDGAYGPMGGVFTTAHDLGRWVGLMLSAFPARDDSEDGPVLRRTLREMQQGSGYPALSVNRAQPGAVLDGSASVYGFGLGVRQTCEQGRLVGHGGAFPGFGSNMQWSPETGVGVFLMANLTYAPTGSIVRELLDILHRSGGMKERDPVPAPALVDAASGVFRLIDDWDDRAARSMAANNLYQDRALDLRRDDIVPLREGLGRCEQGELDPDNALRGDFRMSCENGWLDVRLTLAPTQPPKVQYLRVTGGRTPTDDMERMTSALVDSLRSGITPFETAESFDREALGAKLKSVRDTYGNCSRDELLEGDGETESSVRLRCDRGDVDMTVELEEGKLSSASFAHSEGQRCVP
jgi:CubicO group peptidase (beta-lactamase class C family)